ncbi:hypothetical protein ACHAPJ_008818 [Fusarium lateritium]
MTLFTHSPWPKENIAVFGAGPVAAWHARLAVLLYPDEVSRVAFVGRSRSSLDKLIHSTKPALHQLSPKLSIDSLSQQDVTGYSKRLHQIVSTSDVLFCCTPATEPLFPHRYLEADNNGQAPRKRFISLVGSHKPGMQEVDTETLLSGNGKVYVDSKEGCLKEAGEIIKADLKEKDLTEIGELFRSRKEIHVGGAHNIVYKSVGIGLMDLIIGKALLDVAREEGLGTEIDEI